MRLLDFDTREHQGSKDILLLSEILYLQLSACRLFGRTFADVIYWGVSVASIWRVTEFRDLLDNSCRSTICGLGQDRSWRCSCLDPRNGVCEYLA